MDTFSAYLRDGSTGAPCVAQVRASIATEDVEAWKGRWLPERRAAETRMRQANVSHGDMPRNLHWDWAAKFERRKDMLAHQGFSVWCDGDLQGLMFVEQSRHHARTPVDRGKPLVYVEYLESAPWNRGELLGGVRYKGVGSLLMRCAVTLSVDQQFKGRVGLHSLERSKTFYANACGMQNFGPDAAYSGLAYFEMSAPNAVSFISGDTP